jgi:hypothetical protein
MVSIRFLSVAGVIAILLSGSRFEVAYCLFFLYSQISKMYLYLLLLQHQC